MADEIKEEKLDNPLVVHKKEVRSLLKKLYA